MREIPKSYLHRFEDFKPPEKKRLSKVSESTSSSRPDPKKMKMKSTALIDIPNLPDFDDQIVIPNLHDFDDPESKEEALKDYFNRLKASREPKWLPCPPTASESFLHEIPVNGGEEESIPLTDLQLQGIEALKSVLSAFRAYKEEDEPDKSEKSMAELSHEQDVLSQKHRRREAVDYRRSYMYGFSMVIWVAVHGINSICMVTRRSGPQVRQLFPETIISEMEDLADPSSEARKSIHQSFDKPFGVVSLIPGAVNDVKKAINFIREKMESGSTFTFGYSQTLQTAISGFLLLFDEELKAKDVMVCVLAKGDCTPRDLGIRDAGKNLVVRMGLVSKL